MKELNASPIKKKKIYCNILTAKTNRGFNREDLTGDKCIFYK